MTATDELRCLLDERGVKWWETTDYIGEIITSNGIERQYLVSTCWVSPVFGKVEATDMGDVVLHMACLNGCDFIPEQAVEVTLGTGTCRRLPADNYGTTCIVRGHGYEMEFGYWKCSECGTNCFEGARYCMNCGRKVMDE